MAKLKNTAGKSSRLQPALGIVARSKDLLLQLSKNCNVYFFRFLLRHMDRSLNGQVGWKAIFLLILRLPFSSVQVQARTRVVPKQDNPVWFRHKVKKVRVYCIVKNVLDVKRKKVKVILWEVFPPVRKSGSRRHCIARKCFVCQVKQHTTEFSRDIEVPSKVINLCSAKISS